MHKQQSFEPAQATKSGAEAAIPNTIVLSFGRPATAEPMPVLIRRRRMTAATGNWSNDLLYPDVKLESLTSEWMVQVERYGLFIN